MSEDDPRMRAQKPGLVPGRPHHRDDEPVRLDGRPEPGRKRPMTSGDSALPREDRSEPDEQP